MKPELKAKFVVDGKESPSLSEWLAEIRKAVVDQFTLQVAQIIQEVLEVA